MKKELIIWSCITVLVIGLISLPKELLATLPTGTLRTMSFIAQFAGALVRNAHSKAEDVVSVKDFGAKGDGTTDDTNAFVAAIAASSLSQCIFVPDAVYIVTSGLQSTHPICFTGNQWRIKYTGGSTILAVLSIIGQTTVYPPNTSCSAHPLLTSCYGQHDSFMEGSYIQGAILDGQGNATNGLNLQGVVSGHMNYIRATNVIDVGILCNWCQQITFEHNMVSSNFEAFTTTPQRCLVIDNISSANTVNDFNCEHVSQEGIDLVYALNTVIKGGTSEGIGTTGSGKFGVKMWGNNPSPNPNDDGTDFHYNINNVILMLDLEENHFGGDISCGENCYFNTFYGISSFSNPGVTLRLTAHENSFYGGTIGTGSSAGAQTSGNILRGLSTIDITGTTVWVDNGFNDVGPIYNQFNNVVVNPRNQNGANHDTTFGPTGRQFSIYNESTGNLVDAWVGLSTDQWLGMFSQHGQAALFHYKDASPGMCFIGEPTLRAVSGAQLDACIIAHKWGIGGGFSPGTINPAATLHVFDLASKPSTLMIQATAGQGASPLLDLRDATGNQLGMVNNYGLYTGAFHSFGSTVSASGCGTISGLTGGAISGSFTVTTTSFPCSITITMGTQAGQQVTAVHGWSCWASGFHAIGITGDIGVIPVFNNNTTQSVMSLPASSVAALSQTINFGCIGF